MDKEQLWQAIQSKFAADLTPVSFDNFIKPIQVVDFNQGKMTLEAPSELHASQFEENFKMSFMRYAFDVSHEFVEPTIRVVQPIVNPTQLPEAPTSNEISDVPTTTNLNDEFTFDTFVVGDANARATAAARLVSEEPGRQYNPLMIFGGVGLGNALHERQPNAVIKYATTEEFINEFTDSLRSGEGATARFKNSYRNVDMLLIDDVQFLENKPRIQEEFFNTFNSVAKAGHQIVLTSDRLPKDIPGLEARLVSRFNQGVTMDITKPDHPTRVSILRAKAEQESIKIDYDVIDMVAEQVDSNVRELEGAFKNIVITARFSEEPLTLTRAQQILDSLNILTHKEITIDRIQEIVADYFMVTVNDLKSSKRNKEIVTPRQVAMYLARQLTEASLPKIGQSFGNRDHTTVMHSTDKIQDLYDSDANMRQTVDTLKTQVKEG